MTGSDGPEGAERLNEAGAQFNRDGGSCERRADPVHKIIVRPRTSADKTKTGESCRERQPTKRRKTFVKHESEREQEGLIRHV